MEKKYPITELGLEITQRCNLSCSYCYLGERKAPLFDMTYEIADKSIDLLFHNMNTRIKPSITFWGGEPLLNFDLIKYIVLKSREFERKYSTQVYFTVITNGTILNHKILDFFDKEKVVIQISLDGNETIHNYYRKTKSGKGSFQIIINNLEKIKKYNKTNNYHNLFLKCTLTKKSKPLIKILEYFNEKDIFYCLTPVCPTIFFNKNNEIVEPHEIEKQGKLQFYNWESMFLKGKEIKNRVITGTLIDLFLGIKNRYPCAAGTSSFGIGSDGKIYPCHRLFNNPQYIIGDVWHGINFETSYSLFDHAIDEKNLCNKCGFLYLCRCTCPVDSTCHVHYQNIDPVYCAYSKTLLIEGIRFLLKIQRHHPDKYQDLLKILNNNTMRNHPKQIVEFPFKEIDEIQVIPSGIQNKAFFKPDKVEEIDLEEDGILYIEGDSEKKFIANTTTMAIWDLIDGKRTAQEIAQEIANVCEVKLEDIEEDIYKQLATLKELGFVEEVKETT